MTIKESINSLSNLGVQNNSQVNRSFPSSSPTMKKTPLSYKLDISSYGRTLLNSIEKEDIALVNENVLSYDEKLNLTNKIL